MLQLHNVRTENPDTPQTHLSTSSVHEYHSDTPGHPHRHPSDMSKELKMSTDNNTRQQTPPDILKQHLSVSEGVWGCLLASVVVCWHLDFPGDVLRCLGDVWGISGGVCGYFSGIHGHLRCSDVILGYLGSPSLQYGAVTLLWHSPEKHNFFYLTILRHQNIKMSIYKVDKNHWVMWLFCFLVPVRKIFKNTVALDHPVYQEWDLGSQMWALNCIQCKLTIYLNDLNCQSHS